MTTATHDALTDRGLSRRDFIRLSALAAAGLLSGCATNPVTGESQFMLMSEQEEIQIDRQNSPYQLSADYGITQDRRLEAYINETGQRLATLTHRPRMPYRFNVVNATYINAYAFPGGTISATRGILLKLNDEAELASLLGHELGHVNARHTAQQMSKGRFQVMILKCKLGFDQFFRHHPGTGQQGFFAHLTPQASGHPFGNTEHCRPGQYPGQCPGKPLVGHRIGCRQIHGSLNVSVFQNMKKEQNDTEESDSELKT